MRLMYRLMTDEAAPTYRRINQSHVGLNYCGSHPSLYLSAFKVQTILVSIMLIVKTIPPPHHHT